MPKCFCHTICEIDGDMYYVTIPYLDIFMNMYHTLDGNIERRKALRQAITNDPFFVYRQVTGKNEGMYYSTRSFPSTYLDAFWRFRFREVERGLFPDTAIAMGLVEERANGFRPMLIPLDPQGQPSFSLLGGVPDGTVMHGGSLWVTDIDGGGGEEAVDRFHLGYFADHVDWRIGNTEIGKELEWVVCKGCLLAQQNLVTLHPDTLWDSGCGLPYEGISWR